MVRTQRFHYHEPSLILVGEIKLHKLCSMAKNEIKRVFLTLPHGNVFEES